MNEGAGSYSHHIAEVTIALRAGHVVLGNLTEVGRAGAEVHAIEHRGTQQVVTLLVARSLPVGKGGVHHLGKRHVVGAPAVGLPCGRRDSIDGVVQRHAEAVFADDGDVGNLTVNVLCAAIVHNGSAHLAVDSMIDGPHAWHGVQSLQAHQVAALSPYAALLVPEDLGKGCAYAFCLFLVISSLSALSQPLGNDRSKHVCAIVERGRMGDSPSAIVEPVACPDAAVGIVQSVAVRVEVALLPCQRALDDGEDALRISPVASPLKMPEELVDIVEVHVVMVHLIVSARVAADVSLTVHLSAPAFLSPCQPLLGVLRGRGNGRFYVDNLRCRVCIEMAAGSVVPAQDVACICRPPSCQRSAPANGSVQPRLPVPDAVGSSHEGSSEGVEKAVGSIENDALGKSFLSLGCGLIHLRHACVGDGGGSADVDIRAVAPYLPLSIEHRGVLGKGIDFEDGSLRETSFDGLHTVSRRLGVVDGESVGMQGIGVIGASLGGEGEGIGRVYAQVSVTAETLARGSSVAYTYAGRCRHFVIVDLPQGSFVFIAGSRREGYRSPAEQRVGNDVNPCGFGVAADNIRCLQEGKFLFVNGNGECHVASHPRHPQAELRAI